MTDLLQDAVAWLDLSKEVLPDCKPMTPEERVAINEFFMQQLDEKTMEEHCD